MVDTPKPYANYGEAVVSEAKRIEEDATHSAKGHFEAARLWENVHLWIGIPTTVLAAAAGVSAISNHKLISAGLSLLVAISAGISTFLKAEVRRSRHLKAGNAYKALQNNARIFSEVQCQAGLRPGQLSTTLAKLAARRNKLNDESPQIPRYAFKAGRKGIEEGEANYKVDQGKQDHNVSQTVGAALPSPLRS